jgi:hypothetical protein
MAETDCLSRKKSWVDYQGKSFRVVRNGVGIVSEIPSRYAQSIFNKVFELTGWQPRYNIDKIKNLALRLLWKKGSLLRLILINSSTLSWKNSMPNTQHWPYNPIQKLLWRRIDRPHSVNLPTYFWIPIFLIFLPWRRGTTIGNGYQ